VGGRGWEGGVGVVFSVAGLEGLAGGLLAEGFWGGSSVMGRIQHISFDFSPANNILSLCCATQVCRHQIQYKGRGKGEYK
jgi:hypothetical protein